MSEELTITQYIVKANKTIPNLNNCRYFDIEIGLIPEAQSGYWHFIVSRIKLYNDFERNNCVETIEGDTVEFYTKSVYVKIYKKEKHLENIYIDKTNDRATYVIKVDNQERKYKDVSYYKWEFGKR